MANAPAYYGSEILGAVNSCMLQAPGFTYSLLNWSWGNFFLVHYSALSTIKGLNEIYQGEAS